MSNYEKFLGSTPQLDAALNPLVTSDSLPTKCELPLIASCIHAWLCKLLKGVRAKTGGLDIRTLCPRGAICVPVDFYSVNLANLLMQIKNPRW